MTTFADEQVNRELFVSANYEQFQAVPVDSTNVGAQAVSEILSDGGFDEYQHSAAYIIAESIEPEDVERAVLLAGGLAAVIAEHDMVQCIGATLYDPSIGLTGSESMAKELREPESPLQRAHGAVIMGLMWRKNPLFAVGTTDILIDMNDPRIALMRTWDKAFAQIITEVSNASVASDSSNGKDAADL